jgi:hypothetical protein
MMKTIEWREATDHPPRDCMLVVADEEGGWTNGKWDGHRWTDWAGAEFRQAVRWWAKLKTPAKYYEPGS